MARQRTSRSVWRKEVGHFSSSDLDIWTFEFLMCAILITYSFIHSFPPAELIIASIQQYLASTMSCYIYYCALILSCSPSLHLGKCLAVWARPKYNISDKEQHPSRIQIQNLYLDPNVAAASFPILLSCPFFQACSMWVAWTAIYHRS